MKHAEMLAALIAIAIGAPMIYLFASAVAAGQARAHETPLRAVLGTESFDRLQRGERAEMNYLGRNRRAPDFTLKDQHGKPWRLSDHRGKVIVLNFWTRTCQPCIEEMPSLLDLADRAAKRDDVEVVSISTDANWESVADLFPPNMAMPVLFDSDRAVVRDQFGTRLFPETWFIDPDGIIRLRVDGARDWSQAIVWNLIDQLQ